MIIPITLERMPSRSGQDELVIYELEASANFKAIKKEGKDPSLTELLYHQTEEEMTALTELTNSNV
jgi:hypothetical protein